MSLASHRLKLMHPKSLSIKLRPTSSEIKSKSEINKDGWNQIKLNEELPVELAGLEDALNIASIEFFIRVQDD